MGYKELCEPFPAPVFSSDVWSGIKEYQEKRRTLRPEGLSEFMVRNPKVKEAYSKIVEAFFKNKAKRSQIIIALFDNLVTYDEATEIITKIDEVIATIIRTDQFLPVFRATTHAEEKYNRMLEEQFEKEFKEFDNASNTDQPGA